MDIGNVNIAELGQRYRGQTAKGYDSRRAGGSKWMREQETVGGHLSRLAVGSSILDVPVGTGRFIDFYKQYGLLATGIDVSPDMLAEARRKAAELGFGMSLAQGDIRCIDCGGGSFDTVICIRFLNWVDSQTLDTIIGELARLARRRLILGIRTYVPPAELKLSSLRGLRRWVFQQVWRAGRALRYGLYVHEKQVVRDIFARHHLRSTSATLIDLHRNGTDYNVYCLEKTT